MICPEGNELKNPPVNYTNILVGGRILKQLDGIKFNLNSHDLCFVSHE